MPQPVTKLRETPSQTAGPYVHIGLTPNFVGVSRTADLGRELVTNKTRGDRIVIEGHVYDGAGEPLRDCVVEIWQADAAGLYPSPAEARGTADPDFAGWGRCPADPQTGMFSFSTIKPGSVPFPDGRMQAPHISLWIVARGINLGLNTRLYFPDEAAANAADPVLGGIEHQTQRDTLIVKKQASGAYRFDVHLQGPDETVFFDV
jgi:protocatechuate 3,4-dioxygenase, alpha subunit